MGIFEKVEAGLTLAIVGVVGYMAWKNWDAIISGFCKLPGATATGWCGPNPLDCKMTTAECWAAKGPHATVDTATCTCNASPLDDPCPTGQHKENGVCVLDRDTHGCLTATQHWCDTDNQCRDNALTCTPSGEHDCQEWDPFHNVWLYSPSKCKPCPTGTHRDMYDCVPDTTKPCNPTNGNNGDYQVCPDGSHVCDLRSCPTTDKCSPIGATRCVSTYEQKCLQTSSGLDWMDTGARCNMPTPVGTSCQDTGGMCRSQKLPALSGWHYAGVKNCPTGYGCWYPGALND
jgi:hypothetical protein